jgi:hypothetical protein
MMLHFGQLGSIMLFGLAWFHHFQRRGNDLAASIFLPLVALKPQLSLLFCLALAVWAIYNRHWKVLIGAAFSAICMAALPLLWNPQIWMQYLRAMQTNSVGEWITPTIGAVFRLAFGWSKFCLQFLPPALGALSIAHHW